MFQCHQLGYLKKITFNCKCHCTQRSGLVRRMGKAVPTLGLGRGAVSLETGGLLKTENQGVVMSFLPLVARNN